MLDWQDPAWLAALCAIPLVWWLHRRAQQPIAALVSAIFLWEAASAPANNQAKLAQTDRIWWLRATLVACIALALAKPLWISPHGPTINVWLDDSLSMATIEDGQSRHATATQLLVERLLQAQPDSVTLRALSQPLRSLRLTNSTASWPTEINDFTRPNEQPLLLPDPLALAREQTHWLVTDGADKALPKWAQRAPLSVIINVGGLGDDVALTQLAIRRSVGNVEKWQGIVTLTSTASKPWQVPLTVRAAELTLVDTTLELPPDANVVYRFDVPSSAIGADIVAQIAPKDDLAENNDLQVKTAGLMPVNVFISEECSLYLRAAVRSHPGLVLTPKSAQTGLTVLCGDPEFESAGAILHLHSVSNPAANSMDSVQWHAADPSLSALGLAALDIAPGTLPEAQTGAKPGTSLLTVGNNTIISYENSLPRKVHVWFDIQHRSLAVMPEFPLLVSGLINMALGQSQLDTVTRSSHSREEAHIRPAPISLPDSIMHTPTVKGHDLSAWLAAVALALLCADVAWNSRRTRRRD